MDVISEMSVRYFGCDGGGDEDAAVGAGVLVGIPYGVLSSGLIAAWIRRKRSTIFSNDGRCSGEVCQLERNKKVAKGYKKEEVSQKFHDSSSRSG